MTSLQTSERLFVFGKMLLTDNASLACADEAIIKARSTHISKLEVFSNDSGDLGPR